MNQKTVAARLSLAAATLTVAGAMVAACAAQTRGTATSAADAPTPATPARTLADAGAPFGRLPLVDEIDCAATPPSARFAEVPAGASRVETLLGRPCRVLPSGPGEPTKYFAYRIGANKGLTPGRAYVLTIEYPEDKARTMFVLNRGAEMGRGITTGQALGDTLFGYTDNNAESLKFPLSGNYRTWKAFFYLHDRFPGLNQPRGDGPRPDLPKDGFQVIITQAPGANAPLSAGAAVSRIRLFEVPDPAKLNVAVRFPPAGLPRRHLFSREEMADGVVGGRKPEERGVTEDADWFEYKARTMKYLGMNTFTKDLLEFGHNQGWDAGPDNSWYVNPPFKDRWEKILARVAKYDLDVLPYYEYAGSVGEKGLGREKRSATLGGGAAYTHITWSERFNADVTDPDTLADAKRLLDATITRYKDRARFVGAWLRPRPTHLPISFADAALARFMREASETNVTRDRLKADDALRARYYAWWFGKRRDFLAGLAAHLREKVGPDSAALLFTPDTSEPGRTLPGPGKKVVTDDPATWTPILSAPQPGNVRVNVVRYDEVVAADRQLAALTTPPGTWGEWEWQHSAPQADPQNFQNTAGRGALLTASINRAYTVSSPKTFDAFRTATGLAVAYHFALNEDVMDKSLGYFACDMERSGPYSMLAEARAMAYGDPRYLAYLTSTTFNRGFPEYARAFNAAFLSLPALPSRVLPNASADPEVVVRALPAGRHGTYLAVVNTGLTAKKDVTLTLPAASPVTDAATGVAVSARKVGALKLSLGPCELRALHLPAVQR
jgi:hypothetical protein